MADIKKLHLTRSQIYNFLSTLLRDEISQELFDKLRGTEFRQALKDMVERCSLADLKTAGGKRWPPWSRQAPKIGRPGVTNMPTSFSTPDPTRPFRMLPAMSPASRC